MAKLIETKFIGGKVTETKQIERNGVPVGIVEGYIATFDIDRGDWFGIKDQFTKGAFLASIMDHKTRNRPIRLKDHHGRTVGGFPIDSVKEDERGLFGVGEINLEVQQGREAFALAKQGILSDFSIGFSIDESSLDEQNELRTISKATIWEGSIVDEPMNPQANITAVKSVAKFQDLPIAPKETSWDVEKAHTSLAQYSDETRQKAFVFCGDSVIALQIAEFIDGKLTVVPAAIEKAVEYLKDENNKFDEKNLNEAIKHLEKYYAKMDLESPFSDEEKQFFNVEAVRGFTSRQFEDALLKSGNFSKEAAKFLASNLDLKEELPNNLEDEENSGFNEKILAELESLKSLITK